MGSGSQTTTQVTKLPAYMEKGGEQLFKQAQSATGNPLDFVYTGPRYAGLNESHRDGLDMARAGVGNWQGAFDTAEGILTPGAESLKLGAFDEDYARRYTNPYDSLVTRRAANDLIEQRQIGGRAINDNAVSAGAFGGARHAMQEHLYDEATADSLADLYTSGRQKGWDTALSQYNADRAGAFQLSDALTGLAQSRNSLNAQDVQRLLSIGDVRQGDEQARMNADQAAFREKSQAPLSALEFQRSILSGIPHGQTTTSTSPGANSASQIFGGLLGLGGAFLSDPAAKENIVPVDGEEVLSALRDVPVSTFDYNSEAKGALGAPEGRRIGPMADEWAGAMGGDGKTIDAANAIGALTAAVRALDARTAKIAA